MLQGIHLRLERIEPIRLVPYLKGDIDPMPSPTYIQPRVHLVLLILAVICFAVFTGAGFGWWSVTHPDGFLGLGLALGFGSFI